MDIIMSIHPKWIQKIFTGKKIFEVRRRAPLQVPPFKVYVYCTKGEETWLAGIVGGRESYKLNGNIVGEFTCNNMIDYYAPWKDHESGTCLTARELSDYCGCGNNLTFMHITDPIIYNEPKKLEDFGLIRPPQSWCYVKENK